MITIKVRGIEELKRFLADLPRGTIRTGIAASSEYLVGDATHGLKYYPARISHGEGNPYQWQSDKQRRAFFATDGFGRGIPTKRTFELRNGWDWKPLNNGYQAKIFNTADYAQFVQGDDQQRGHRADKWRQVDKIISTNIDGAIRAAAEAVIRYIKAKS